MAKIRAGRRSHFRRRTTTLCVFRRCLARGRFFVIVDAWMDVAMDDAWMDGLTRGLENAFGTTVLQLFSLTRGKTLISSCFGEG